MPLSMETVTSRSIEQEKSISRPNLREITEFEKPPPEVMIVDSKTMCVSLTVGMALQPSFSARKTSAPPSMVPVQVSSPMKTAAGSNPPLTIAQTGTATSRMPPSQTTIVSVNWSKTQSSIAVVGPGVVVVVGAGVDVGSSGSSTGATTSTSTVVSVVTATVASPASIDDWKSAVALAATSWTNASMSISGRANRRFRDLEESSSKFSNRR